MKYERTCIDLFAGLGCWSIAAESVGVRTVAMCEIDQFLRSGLERIWRCPVHPDIKTFPAEEYRGVWAVFGSPPCQPASLAGKRRGAADDRWLWGETIQVCAVAQPTWFCFENPHGIDGVGLDRIIAELEGLGYEVQAIRIPACAVDSPQDRDRFWILGHSNRVGRKGIAWKQAGNGEIQNELRQGFEGSALAGVPSGGQPMRGRTRRQYGLDLQQTQSRSLAGAGCQCSEGRTAQSSAREGPQPRHRDARPVENGPLSDYQWIEFDGELYRAPTGLYELADGCAAIIPKKFRSRLIGALGNAIVWKVAQQIVKAMIEAEA